MDAKELFGRFETLSSDDLNIISFCANAILVDREVEKYGCKE
jgi:hypothetical protein